MKRFRRVAAAVGLLSIVPGAAFLLQCSSSEPEGRDPTTVCDQAQLNLADPAEATVKIYLDTATEANARLMKLRDRFKDICNAINKDLGESEGADVHAACNKIADRIAAANATAPVPDSGLPAAVWATTLFDNTCALDAKIAATCLDSCSAKKGCDPVATCPAGKAVGKCTGACSACATAPANPGESVPCTGGCGGECTFPADQDGGPACQGECRGTCSAPTWLGACSTGCSAGFRGKCQGTCTGSCDGVAYPGVDGGEADAGADAGDAEAGTVTLPGTGTCNGICTGACAGEASGSCGAKCAGDFAGGACLGACVGVCNGINAACVNTCKGVCVTRGACAAACVGTCDKPLEGASCTTTPGCDEPNPICKGACTLHAALGTTCKPAAMDIRIAGDYKLPFALKAHAADFTAAAREANLIAGTLGGVLQRPSGDFQQIGVVLDNARACAAGATTAYDDVRKLANETVGASLVVKGIKF